MNLKFTLMAVIGLLFFGEINWANAQSDTIYVKEAAAGANDGTSWENAFNDLQDALNLVEDGDEVWVAQGIYYPDTLGGDSSATFLVEKDIKLLGGFNGDIGGSGNDQNPDQWISRLSGDLSQDDILDDLDSNRSDNVMTVLTLGLAVTEATLVDGFYIQNGHADGDDTQFQYRRGGGLFSFGSPVLSRLVFDNNFADAGGGGLYLHTSNAEGTLVDNCYFRRNEAEDGGGAMSYILGGEGVVFQHCDFYENFSENGGAIRIYNSNAVIDDCQFQFNRSERGGAVDVRSIWDDNETMIQNCFFTENIARNGGAVNFQTNSGLGSHNNFLHIEDSDFWFNQATINDPDGSGGRQGGAVRIIIERTTNGCGASIRGGEFMGNFSERDGGAIAAFLRGESLEFLVEGTMLTFNSARNAGAVQVLANDVGSGTATLRDCIFLDNAAEENGGALRMLGRETSDLTYHVEGCQFTLNNSGGNGGVMDIQSRDTTGMGVQVHGCIFEENSTVNQGGVVSVDAEGGTLAVDFEQNHFRANTATVGAVMAGFPASATSAEVVFDNCLFTENSSNDMVISLDSFPSVEFKNCTLTDNMTNAVGTLNGSKVSLQNNIFFNPNFSEYIDDQNGNVLTSLAGNLIGDSSMDFALIVDDQSGLDPMFESPIDGNYQLLETSPAVDAGVLPNDVPDFDLAGNERVVNCIDAGAFESPYIVSTACLSDAAEEMENVQFIISPNPANEVLNLAWEIQNVPEIQIELLDVNGRNLRSEKISNFGSHQMDVSNLQNGVYLLRMTTLLGSEVRRVLVQ